MLGKSGCAALGFAILAALSCAHNVPQDKATGPDGKVKGAKAITLENGEAKANGIVTYPGGDRVDWKLLELPANETGSLDIKLTWTPPRPGLQLAFDVFDEWNTPIVQSKKTSKKRSTSRVKTAVVDNARGKYFIRVYAMNRGDAGKYKLTVEFKPAAGTLVTDLTKIDIPEPPKLAGVPEAEATCDEFTFDPKNPACRTVCPTAGAPPGWPACKGKCPDPPDPANEACWDKVCPNPMTQRSKACMRQKEKFPPCDKANPDPENWKCGVKDPPVVGRVIKNEVQGSDVVITIAVGSDNGITKDWTGRVLRGDSDTPIDGGDVKVIRVGKRETIGKVRMTTDQIAANPKVKLSPP
jgi:hypothetical protein